MLEMLTGFMREENGFAVVNWAVLVGAFLLLSALAMVTYEDSAELLSQSAKLSFSAYR